MDYTYDGLQGWTQLHCRIDWTIQASIWMQKIILEELHLCWPALMDTKMLFNCCATILTDFPPLCSEQETTVNTQMSQFSFGNDSGGKSF